VLHDLKVAALFLTRFPVQVDGRLTMRDLAAAVYAFPVIGAAVGLLGGAGYLAAYWLGLPSLPGALGAVAAMILATGALHEDGLADTMDGLGAGPDRTRAFEIMRDSRIGTYGALALMLTLLARVLAMAPLWEPRLMTAVLVAAAMGSRSVMPVVMLWQPSAKAAGLAAETGRPELPRVLAAVGLAVAACLLLLPLTLGLPALLAAAAVSLLVAAWLGRRFGGCTGDTLGAVQQTAEVAFLLTIAARY
jgi:adenosylcobinamide-GDP ribazoletransferase